MIVYVGIGVLSVMLLCALWILVRFIVQEAKQSEANRISAMTYAQAESIERKYEKNKLRFDDAPSRWPSSGIVKLSKKSGSKTLKNSRKLSRKD